MGDAATLRSDWQPPLLAPPLPGMGQVIAWTTYSKVVYALRREAVAEAVHACEQRGVGDGVIVEKKRGGIRPLADFCWVEDEVGGVTCECAPNGEQCSFGERDTAGIVFAVVGKFHGRRKPCHSRSAAA